jgi:fibronectin type 3 domain-containing protein
VSARALALATALASAVGCATSLDLADVRDAVGPLGPQAAPELSSDPNTALDAVEGLRATSGELRAIPLRWDASREPEVAGYVVERSASADGPFAYISTLADRFQTVYVDTGRDLAPKRTLGLAGGGLAHGDTYYYRVRAFDRGGRIASVPATVVSGTTAAKPEPPSGVQAYSHLPRRVALRWLPAENANVTGYVVSRSPSPSGVYAEIARIEGRHQTVYVDRELPDLGVFYYRVASVDAVGGVGDPSGAERAVTKGEPLPPTGLRIAAQTIGANTLAWNANVEPDLRGYRLLRKRAGAKDPEIAAELGASTTQFTDLAVAPGETISYRLIALDSDDLRSGPSDPIEIAGIAYDPSAEATGSGVQLSWSPAAQSGFEATRVLRNGNEIARATRASHFDPDGKPGDRYALIGLRHDGSEAPKSKEVAAE